jgi:Sec-independent protein translocase protein TatA
MMRGLGKGMKEFKEAQNGVTPEPAPVKETNV